MKKINIINRTQKNSEILAKDIGGPINIINWNNYNNALAESSLVINTTILGMNNKPPLELNLDTLPKDAIVNDIVYAPIETPLLRKAKARGNPTVNGIGMLLHQARPAFSTWFGVEPKVTDELCRHILALNRY